MRDEHLLFRFSIQGDLQLASGEATWHDDDVLA
jgi:hypothetical protein